MIDDSRVNDGRLTIGIDVIPKGVSVASAFFSSHAALRDLVLDSNQNQNLGPSGYRLILLNHFYAFAFFHLAQRALAASEIFLRAAADMWRLRPFRGPAFAAAFP